MLRNAGNKSFLGTSTLISYPVPSSDENIHTSNMQTGQVIFRNIYVHATTVNLKEGMKMLFILCEHSKTFLIIKIFCLVKKKKARC